MTEAQFRALVPGDMIVVVKLSPNRWCPVGTEFEVLGNWIYVGDSCGKVEDSYSIWITPLFAFAAYKSTSKWSHIEPGLQCSINVTWAQYIELIPEPLTRLELIYT